jgi:hypothetical protein
MNIKSTLTVAAIGALALLPGSNSEELDRKVAMQAGAIRYLAWADVLDYQHDSIAGLMDMLNEAPDIVKLAALADSENIDALQSMCKTYTDNCLAAFDHCSEWAEEYEDCLDVEIATSLLTSAKTQLARMQGLVEDAKELAE